MACLLVLRFFFCIASPPHCSPLFSRTTAATGHVTGQPRRAAPLAARAARVRSFCYKWAPLGPIITAAACMRTRTGATSRPPTPPRAAAQAIFRPQSPLKRVVRTPSPWRRTHNNAPCWGRPLALRTMQRGWQSQHTDRDTAASPAKMRIWKLKSQKLNREK